ncbi:MAG: OmpA family protein [Paludibacter sp.]|nr:OmpA family protein [Paludibacter sp.]
MKQKKGLMAVVLSGAILLAGCSSMSKTVKGGLLGGSAGAALGAGVGALIGHDAKSAAIGAGIGTAVGATTGVIIGKKMDKAAAEAAAIEGAKVDSIRDANNLKALKVTFDSGILFKTGKSTLNTSAQAALTKFAKILVENPTMDIAIMGHTDNVGSLEINQKLSQDRAQSVADFLETKNVTATQFKEIIGMNFSDPIADNSTAAGKAANRRVEVYMYASEKMIKDAEAQ